MLADTSKLREQWERLGAVDPLWAVLTDPTKRGGKWDPGEFFATGVAEIASVLAEAGDLVRSRRNALDFGCGVGRLSQALARHFDRVVGVDISEAMVEQARLFNAAGERCVYLQNDSPDLAVLGGEKFDFIYSNIVLQHIHPLLALGYVREFVRVLANGGLLVFQAPSRVRLRPVPALKALLARLGLRGVREESAPTRPVMEMHGIPRSTVVTALAGAEILRIERDGNSGDDWIAWRYWATRR